MTEDQHQPKGFGDLSDDEIQKVSQEMMESIPELMSEVLGMDMGADSDPGEQSIEYMEQMLMQLRDIAQTESEEEEYRRMLKFLDESFVPMLSQTDLIEQEESGGLEALVEYYRESLADGYEMTESWGYGEYFEKAERLATELINEEKDHEVTDLYNNELERGTGITQRFANPLIEEYLPLLEDSDIDSATEVRKYQDMYEETAELYTGLLPEFISILQIAEEGDHEYEELKNESLNNLLQKLNSKKFSQYNIFAECLNKDIRNSVVHRDAKINPTDESIEFYDRGDFVDELSYTEFREETIELFSAFYALWVFNGLITYHKIKHLPETLESLD